jgi:hypothetical protein
LNLLEQPSVNSHSNDVRRPVKNGWQIRPIVYHWVCLKSVFAEVTCLKTRHILKAIYMNIRDTVWFFYGKSAFPSYWHKLHYLAPRFLLYGLCSVSHKGASLWNMIPNHVRLESDLKNFKTGLQALDISSIDDRLY